jgi:hypothetical protein
MSSPHPPDGEFDSALTDALHRRASTVQAAAADGRARFDEHLAVDMRHRHRRRVAMSVTGVIAVLGIGAGAIAFANGRDSEPSQTVTAAADQLKIRVPTAPSRLPKLLPAVPQGWVLESAGDYAPTESEGTTLPDRGNALTQVYRSQDGAAAIRVDIHTDPTGVGGFSPAPNGNPDASTVHVHGQPALLTVDPKGLDMTMLMWGEGEHTTVTVMSSGISQEQLLAFAESLQPAAEGWNATALPAGVTLLYSGDPDAPMGYGGPSWQLGYRGPEDLSQPQDPSISVSAAKGTADALVVFPGPADHPEQVSVANQPAIYMQGPEADGAQTYCTLVWIDRASGLVMTMNALGVSRNDMISFAASMHAVPDADWQQAVAEVLPKREPTGPVEPPVPTQPEGFPNLAAGTLPDGRVWTINATRYRDEPDANLVCGDLTFGGSSETVGGACANVDGSPRPGISIGTDGGALLFGATPASATTVSVEQAGADPVTAPTVASNDPSIELRWFVVEVGDSKKVTAIVGHDANGAEVFRLAQPLGPPYPDYEALDKAQKRELASGTVDGAQWTLVAADAPLSDGSGPVTCVTLTFASESSMTCPVVAAGGVNGNGIIDATVAILRKRNFVLAHLEPGIAEFCVTTDDEAVIRVPVIPTGSGSGSTVAVVHLPDGKKPVELHAIDPQGQDMGMVDISQVMEAPKPMPLGAADSTRSAVGSVGTSNTAAG